MLESLESRRLMTASPSPLVIAGTSLADCIVVSQRANTLTVNINGVKTEYDAATVSKLVVWAKAGDDRISLAGVKVKAEVFGEGGHDYIIGGQLGDLIEGGKGCDTLVGAGGDDRLLGCDDDDVLIGGTGRDTMSGGNGKDVAFSLLGGDTRVELERVIKAEVAGLGCVDVPGGKFGLGAGADIGLGIRSNLGLSLCTDVNVLAKLSLLGGVKLKAGADISAIVGVLARLSVNASGQLCAAATGSLVDVKAAGGLLARLGVDNGLVVDAHACLKVMTRIGVQHTLGAAAALLDVSGTARLKSCIDVVAQAGAKLKVELGWTSGGYCHGTSAGTGIHLGVRLGLNVNAAASA